MMTQHIEEARKLLKEIFRFCATEDKARDIVASALAAAEERGRREERERCAAKGEAFDKIVTARRKHVDAVNAYNARRELATAERMRGSWAIKLDEEYRAMHDAQSVLFATMQAVCDDAITKEPTP